MLTTKHMVTDVREVPESWIFEYYAKLDAVLEGQEVKINSLFNPKDKRPSMCIFFSKKYDKYWFHDFSSGKSGDAIRLVQELFDFTYPQACDRIRSDYRQFNQQGVYTPGVHRRSQKYRVTDYKKRSWNILDAGFWTSYHIGSGLLEHYNVAPLEYYMMTNENTPQDQFTVTGEYVYGYFTSTGILYKIYRPKRTDCRFIKVANHLQGLDQLKQKRCLLIVSSLKDGMSLVSLGPELDFIAPDSENILLEPVFVQEMITRYNGWVFTLLDNDTAGIKAMQTYRQRDGLSPILLSLKKDVSDSVETYGAKAVLFRVVPLIDRKLNLVKLAG